MTRINDTDNDSDNRFGSSVDAFVSSARTCPRTSARAPHSMAESRPPPPPGFPGHSPATSSSCIVALFRWYTCAAPPISNTRDRPDTNAPRLPSGACHSYEGTETAAKRASKVARGPLHERPLDSSKPTAAPRPPQTSNRLPRQRKTSNRLPQTLEPTSSDRERPRTDFLRQRKPSNRHQARDRQGGARPRSAAAETSRGSSAASSAGGPLGGEPSVSHRAALCAPAELRRSTRERRLELIPHPRRRS